MIYAEHRIRQLKAEIDYLKRKSPHPNFFSRCIASKEREIKKLEKLKG